MSYYIPDTGFGLNDNINANSMADDFALLALAALKSMMMAHPIFSGSSVSRKTANSKTVSYGLKAIIRLLYQKPKLQLKILI